MNLMHQYGSKNWSTRHWNIPQGKSLQLQVAKQFGILSLHHGQIILTHHCPHDVKSSETCPLKLLKSTTTQQLQHWENLSKGTGSVISTESSTKLIYPQKWQSVSFGSRNRQCFHFQLSGMTLHSGIYITVDKLWPRNTQPAHWVGWLVLFSCPRVISK